MSTDAALKALAEPHRRSILRLVRDEPRSVNEIAEHFDITQQAVSLHLKVLRESGLVSVHRDGQRRLYLVNPDGLRSLREFIADLLWPASLDRLKELVETDRAVGRQAGNTIARGRTRPQTTQRVTRNPRAGRGRG